MLSYDAAMVAADLLSRQRYMKRALLQQVKIDVQEMPRDAVAAPQRRQPRMSAAETRGPPARMVCQRRKYATTAGCRGNSRCHYAHDECRVRLRYR